MAQYIKDGFTFFDGFFKTPVLSIDTIHDIDKKIDYIIRNKIKNISFDVSLTDFSFLKDISFIEEIYISKNMDRNTVSCLKALKRLIVNIDNGKPDIDYENFSALEYLSIDWYNKFPDLSKNENLKELLIWKFRPKSKSFSELNLPKNLYKIHITESNILNLGGLNLQYLKEIEGHHCNSLESVKGLKEVRKSLKVLVLDYCRKLSEYDDLQYCKELNKIILGDCGDLPSLNWLTKLERVNYFSFWGTKVVDGDISPCLGVDYVSFKNDMHYNHKVEDFKGID